MLPNRFLRRLIPLFFIAVQFAQPAWAQNSHPVIGIIDYDRLIMDSALGKQSIAPLNDLMAKKKKELRALEDELKTIRAKATEQASKSSEQQLATYQRQFNEKLEALRSHQREANAALDKLRVESIGAFNKRAIPVIQALGKEHGYTMILQKQHLGLLYLDANADITEQVVQRLNALPANGR